MCTYDAPGMCSSLVYMHRPALIGPSSVTGLGNQRDWLSLLIRASFDLGVVPLEHEQDYKMLYLVPVDYVARGVLMTSLGVHRGKVWCVCVCGMCVCKWICLLCEQCSEYSSVE